MQLMLTNEEKKYIEISRSSEYGLKVKENAPPSVARSLNRKIEAHKRWIRESTSTDG